MVLTHVVAIFFLLQTVKKTSEVSFKGFESFRLWQHEDDGASLLCYFRCLLFSTLALCYASCIKYFLSLDLRCNKIDTLL